MRAVRWRSTFDLFWSFRSPYSYLATGRLVRLAAEYDVDHHRAPGAADRGAHARVLQQREPALAALPAARHHAGGPVPRHRLRVAAARPDRAGLRHPRGGRRAALHPPAHPPRHRGGRARPRHAVHRRSIADHLERHDRRLERRRRTSPRRRRAPDWISPRSTPRSPSPEHSTMPSSRRTSALEAAGHWGVPTMVFEGEPFFGQDRIDLLIWRMQQRGLQPRSPRA